MVLNFMEFEENYNFENQFLVGNGAKYEGKLFDTQYKKLREISIENCVFYDMAQFQKFCTTLKEVVSVANILAEGTLQKLRVKDIQIKGEEEFDQCEIQILSLFSVPKYNEQMYNTSLTHLDISISQSQRNLD